MKLFCQIFSKTTPTLPAKPLHLRSQSRKCFWKSGALPNGAVGGRLLLPPSRRLPICCSALGFSESTTAILLLDQRDDGGEGGCDGGRLRRALRAPLRCWNRGSTNDHKNTRNTRIWRRTPRPPNGLYVGFSYSTWLQQLVSKCWNRAADAQRARHTPQAVGSRHTRPNA